MIVCLCVHVSVCLSGLHSRCTNHNFSMIARHCVHVSACAMSVWSVLHAGFFACPSVCLLVPLFVSLLCFACMSACLSVCLLACLHPQTVPVCWSSAYSWELHDQHLCIAALLLKSAMADVQAQHKAGKTGSSRHQRMHSQPLRPRQMHPRGRLTLLYPRVHSLGFISCSCKHQQLQTHRLHPPLH